MCTKSQLTVISNSLADEAARIVGDKLDSVVLFGSYARGDFDSESDIDIMIRIDCETDALIGFRKSLFELANRLSLENDITVSLVIVDLPTYDRYKNFYPFYKNVEKEGVKIA